MPERDPQDAQELLAQDEYSDGADNEEGISFPKGVEPTSLTALFFSRLSEQLHSAKPRRRAIILGGTLFSIATVCGATGASIGWILGNERGKNLTVQAANHVENIPPSILSQFDFKELLFNTTELPQGGISYTGISLKAKSPQELLDIQEAIAPDGHSFTEHHLTANPPQLQYKGQHITVYDYPKETQPIHQGINIVTLTPISSEDPLPPNNYAIKLPNQFDPLAWRIFALYINSDTESSVSLYPDSFTGNNDIGVTSENLSLHAKHTSSHESYLVIVLNRR